MPDFPVVRSEPLFSSRNVGSARDSWASTGELLLTADGDLILHTTDSGWWVATTIGEMVALYHQWHIVAGDDVPRLVGDPDRAFDVMRERLAPGGQEHSIDVFRRFLAWLEAAGVPCRHESYDEYD